MHSLLTDPYWRPDDLGRPIPDSPHAVSVCLPTWRDNIGYEEGDHRVHSRLTTGYPRFVYNGFCRKLFESARSRFARDGEAVLIFPLQPAADRLARFLTDTTRHAPRVVPLDRHAAHAVCFPQAHADLTKSYWQHTGEGISSRRAEACLTDAAATDGTAAKRILRDRIGQLAGVPGENVLLFSCGMNAIYRLHRALTRLFPQRRSAQFGFPYVDSLKVQEKFGAGVEFFPHGGREDLQRLETLLNREPLSGIYTEFPSNPLLLSPDMERLAALARQHAVPLIVDETLAGFANVDLLPVADVLVTSLTKFFSGVGDVTAGSLILNPRSPFATDLRAELERDSDDPLWGADAVVLEYNSRDYPQRIVRINRNAAALADFLASHPAVAQVYYPRFQTPEQYDAFRRPSGGYGGLLSILLHDAPRRTPSVFDALRVCKGPNLGTNYTLACPYTLLAHYQELDFAESCQVSRHLIRLSVGLEEPEDLIERFQQALATVL